MTTDVTIINTVASVSVTNGDSLDVEITIPVIAVSASTVGIQGTSGAGSDEDVQDIVGAMVSGNTETLITVTYQDIDGTLDFSVDNDLANYDNTTSGFITGYAVTEGDVTAHQAALSITESQISDFGSYIPFADATIANMLVSNGTSFVSVPMSGDATIAANGAISVTFPTAPVTSVNTKTGVVVLDPDDLSDAATINKFVTASDITVLGNTSGENTGDQTIPATGVDFDPVGTDNSDNNAINTLYSGLVSNATHTGDVTGANALTIGANKVTLAMQSQMATASFLGRTTAATGNVEVLSKAQALAVLNVEDGATAGGAVDSVNAQTGVVVLDADDISDAATTNKFVTAYDVTVLGNTSNTNSGDNAANTTYDNDYRAANFVSGTDYEPAKGIDDNFVTDVEKVVIGNTSGTNTGDQTIPASGVDFDPVGTDNSDNNAVNTLYSGLVTNATHTGDVTGSGALTIATGAVTLAKMANMATASLMGRNTAGTGVPEVLSKATTLALLNVEDGATADQTGAQIKTAYEGETNHSLDNITLTGGVTEDQYSLTGTVLEPANGTVQYKTLASNTTFTEALADGESILLAIDDGTAYTITWPTITWVTDAATAPTLETTGYTFIVIWHMNAVLYGAKVNS